MNTITTEILHGVIRKNEKGELEADFVPTSLWDRLTPQQKCDFIGGFITKLREMYVEPREEADKEDSELLGEPDELQEWYDYDATC